MSGNEKLRMYADKLTAEQANVVVGMIEGYLHALEEALDDAFCRQLLDEARADGDDEYEDFSEFVKRLEAE